MNNLSARQIKSLLSIYFIIHLILYGLQGWHFGVIPLLAITFVFCSAAFLFMLGGFSFWRKIVWAWFAYMFLVLAFSILPKLLFLVMGSEEFDTLRLLLVLINLGLTIYLFVEFRKFERSLRT